MKGINMIIAAILLLSAQDSIAQGGSLRFIFMPEGTSFNGGCNQESDCANDRLCYALEYTPGYTGYINFHNFAFEVECLDGSNPVDYNAACFNQDGSSTDVCTGSSSSFVSNGNSTVIAITEGSSFTIHQVCFDISSGQSIAIAEDAAQGVFVDVTLLDDTMIQDNLSFDGYIVDYDRDCNINCGTAGNSCNRSFSSNSADFDFNNVMHSFVAVATTASNSNISQSFDIYDELNFNCGSSGGQDDVEVSVCLANTIDPYGNGIIDILGGMEFATIQSTSGLFTSIPLGTSSASESSSGDTRCYKVEVDYASHITVRAWQLDVLVDGVNTTGSVYESAAISFWDSNDNPFGTATYQGYFTTSADLSGNCNNTAAQNQWVVSGNGVYLANQGNTVNLSDPCNPVASGMDGISDTKAINAHHDAGISSGTIIGGFSMQVCAEDIAATSTVDDGSSSPDDGIAGNAETSTSSAAGSSLVGFNVNGCIFLSTLPVEWVAFEAKAKNSHNELIWSSQNEKHAKQYVVEKSFDGSKFFEIATIDLDANNNEISTYQYKDHDNIEGNSYYRIKQIDTDGGIDYSDVRNVSRVASKVLIYPTVTRSELNLVYEGSIGQGSAIIIYSTAGRVIKSIQVDDQLPRVISIDDLPHGIYYLKIESQSDILFETERFIKC